ncbi:MAG TPA: Xaa-Pro peptidase family protein [Caldisericia bacterium]|nr:Xaa-Pro peptidase family protein [Caldisericia bacterium]HQN36910.1 Xaa-Pro peptidase family protein [Caldisericia bacterium]HUN18804.1 Xaa-Pro peptidase family protein [Caldisericia bacterium]
MDARIHDFREAMKDRGIDAALFVSTETRINKNVFYLSGFTGEDGYLLVTQDSAQLFVDGRYPEQAHEEAKKGIDVALVEYPISDFLVKMIQDGCIQSLGLEESILPHSFYKIMSEKLPKTVLKSSDGMCEAMRIIKSQDEIEFIRNSCKVACESFTETLGVVKEGVSERDICAELEYQMKRRGAKKPSFDIIVASGFRAAMAHGVASDKKLKAGEFVVFDWGCFVNNYASDFTRTLVVGEPTPKHIEIYDTVRRAQEAAMGKFKPGTKACDADKVARDIISNAGYEKNFNHSLGHGVGLDIHERPGASMRTEDEFKAGMICTNEPGIYIEGWGGVRIEDTVLISDEGGVPLANLSKDLIIV